MKLKPFNVYKHPIHGFDAVKVGFSWPAFSFGFFWMFTKKLWTLGVLWVVLYIVAEMLLSAPVAVSSGLTQGILFAISLVVYLALWLVPAYKGNEWLERHLIRRGYQKVRSMQTHTVDSAIAEAITRGPA
jgi:hypothetical protein